MKKLTMLFLIIFFNFSSVSFSIGNKSDDNTSLKRLSFSMGLLSGFEGEETSGFYADLLYRFMHINGVKLILDFITEGEEDTLFGNRIYSVQFYYYPYSIQIKNLYMNLGGGFNYNFTNKEIKKEYKSYYGLALDYEIGYYLLNKFAISLGFRSIFFLKKDFSYGGYYFAVRYAPFRN